MKHNNSLFRKAYNNHFNQNGSDISSTADNLMRKDIGDGLFIEGENPMGGFVSANGLSRSSGDWANNTESMSSAPNTFQTENYPNITYEDGDFSTIAPTPTGLGDCYNTDAGTGFASLMNILQNYPVANAPIISNDFIVPINKWMKFDVTSCFANDNVTEPQNRLLYYWADDIYVKIIGAWNFFNFKPLFKVGFYHNGDLYENFTQLTDAYKQLYANSLGRPNFPYNKLIVREIYLGSGDGIYFPQNTVELQQYINSLGVTQPSSDGTPTLPDLGPIFDNIPNTDQDNMAVTPPPPSWVMVNNVSMPDIDNCSGITSELFSLYSPFLSAYVPIFFGNNTLESLQTQNPGYFLEQSMSGFQDYIMLIIIDMMCSAGMNESDDPDLQEFYQSAIEQCKLVSVDYPTAEPNGEGPNGQGPNGEGPVPTGEGSDDPIPVSNDGGMVGVDPTIDTSATDRPLPMSGSFYNAAGNNYAPLIQAINNVKNWIANNHITRTMIDAYDEISSYRNYGDGEQGGAYALWQLQYRAFGAEGIEVPYFEKDFKAVQDYYKIMSIAEGFLEVYIRIANCLPTNVKNAGTNLLKEFFARNTKFFDFQTDNIEEIQNVFAELGQPIPDNFFREYTSIEYNALSNQLENMENQVQVLLYEINNLNEEIANLSSQYYQLSQMNEYEQGEIEDLQNMLDTLTVQIAMLHADLVMHMELLDMTNAELDDVLEENAELQADLSMSNAMISNLQNDFNATLNNQEMLQVLVINLENQLAQGDAVIQTLHNELNQVLSELVESQGVIATLQQVNEGSNQQIVNLQTQLSEAYSQIDLLENGVNQQDVAYFEQQIAQLVATNQNLVNTIQQMESQSGVSAVNLGSEPIDLKGQVDPKTGRGTLQLLLKRKNKPARPSRPQNR